MISVLVVIVALFLIISCNLSGSKSASDSPTVLVNEIMAESKTGDYKSIKKHICKKDEVAFYKIMKLTWSFTTLSGKSVDEFINW